MELSPLEESKFKYNLEAKCILVCAVYHRCTLVKDFPGGGVVLSSGLDEGNK